MVEYPCPDVPWPAPEPDRMLGCLLGGAIGDALGVPIEHRTLAEIRDRHGPDGVTGFVDGRFGRGAISDETQLTLFTAEAMISVSERAREGAGDAPTGIVQQCYLDWLDGQDGVERESGKPVPNRLMTKRALTDRRDPGRAVVLALRGAAANGPARAPFGTPDAPVNDSKGCGAVVRAAPCGFPYRDPRTVFDLGRGVAALTHGHRTGQLAAGALALLISGLVRGAEPAAAVAAARSELARHPGHDETSAKLRAAVELAGAGPGTAERLETLGPGWTADEALAIGVYAALAPVPGDDPQTVGRHRLLLAVNHSGNSDSTGSVCGNIVGAAGGTAALPRGWRDEVEVRREIESIVHDAKAEFAPNPPTSDYGTAITRWNPRWKPTYPRIPPPPPAVPRPLPGTPELPPAIGPRSPDAPPWET